MESDAPSPNFPCLHPQEIVLVTNCSHCRTFHLFIGSPYYFSFAGLTDFELTLTNLVRICTMNVDCHTPADTETSKVKLL